MQKLSDIAKSNIKSSKTEKKKTPGKTIKSSKKGNKK